MANVAGNVMNGTTGAVNFAIEGTALPTNPTDALDGAFDEVGYISEDGVTQSIGTETTQVKAWQNGDVIQETETSHAVTYQFTMLETNPTALEAYYGDYTDSGAFATIEIAGGQETRGRWIIQVVDDTDIIRIVIPDGKRTANADVVYKNGEPVGYGITLTAFPDATGVKAYKYLATSAAS